MHSARAGFRRVHRAVGEGRACGRGSGIGANLTRSIVKMPAHKGRLFGQPTSVVEMPAESEYCGRLCRPQYSLSDFPLARASLRRAFRAIGEGRAWETGSPGTTWTRSGRGRGEGRRPAPPVENTCTCEWAGSRAALKFAPMRGRAGGRHRLCNNTYRCE